MNDLRKTVAAGPTGRFGAFGGVFTPCTLTILGVIMFLRFGQVVGNAGVWAALLIVLAAKAITTLTALSLSAIATNQRVRGGGAYFLISRSLGIEFGGAIGLVFFVAQAVSVAMYVIGFSEALLAAFPHAGLSLRAVSTLTNVIVFVCVMIGAGWTIKLQYGILALLGLSLVSFFGGAFSSGSMETLRSNLGPGYVEGQSLWTMFALFFPAATGIMAGANMSGDLKDPGKAIPSGTLTSILFTGGIYLLMAVALGFVADRDTLIGSHMVVRDVAWVPLLITLGIFAATLSSALGSMMGAPRILQALARDEVFLRLRFFAVGSGRDGEPRRAIVLTFLLAQAGIMLGDLDVIAPIIAMFFMLTYGYLNLATFYEAATRNPSYRPTFRWAHWSMALAGAVGCGTVMILVSPPAAGGSVLAILLLQGYIRRRKVITSWGDVQGGVVFERARKNLLKLEREEYHPKNWRPSILALAGAAGARPRLTIYSHWLTGGRGMLTLAQVITGDIGIHFRRRLTQEDALRKHIRSLDVDAFPAVLVAPTLFLGIEALVQCYGIGAFRPNVCLMGWSTDRDRIEQFGSVLRMIAGQNRSTVLVRPDPSPASRNPWIAPEGTIDVWWRGKENGHLMLLLAHLLAENRAWRGRKIRLLRTIPSEAGREEATRHLQELIASARIDATPVVLVSDKFFITLHDRSRHAAAVFLGFDAPAEGNEENFVRRVESMMAGLGTAILVRSAQDMTLE